MSPIRWPNALKFHQKEILVGNFFKGFDQLLKISFGSGSGQLQVAGINSYDDGVLHFVAQSIKRLKIEQFRLYLRVITYYVSPSFQTP